MPCRRAAHQREGLQGGQGLKGGQWGGRDGRGKVFPCSLSPAPGADADSPCTWMYSEGPRWGQWGDLAVGQGHPCRPGCWTCCTRGELKGRESPTAWAKQQAGEGEGGSCSLQHSYSSCPQPCTDPFIPGVTGMDDCYAAGHWCSRCGPCPGECQGRLGVEAAPRPPSSPSPKCATGSISQR